MLEIWPGKFKICDGCGVREEIRDIKEGSEGKRLRR
jgi:hypothetical protein